MALMRYHGTGLVVTFLMKTVLFEPMEVVKHVERKSGSFFRTCNL